MNLSPKGAAFIHGEEGCVLAPYIDSAGIRSVGWGHARWTGGTITREQADALFAGDVHPCEIAVNDAVTSPLTQDQFDALVSFTFNCGTGALRSSSLLTRLNALDYHGAAMGFLLWDKALDPKTRTLEVNPVLAARRLREAILFYGSDPREEMPETA